jgi:tetratricopeptide (TPR) repeat protein/predicted Ser/Thr protein kinase
MSFSDSMTDHRSNPPNGPVAVRDLTGTTVGRFAVRARLGAGGMGEVYRAEDTKLKRPVALKRVAPELATDPAYRSRFLREAERASSLAHEHIAAVYDVLEENGEIFVVMEYVEGQTLRERMREPFNEQEFFELAIQCAEGLVAAQARGIVHRDIKPENVMVTAAGKVKILDFGVARRMPQKGAAASTETSDSTSGRFSGTPAYMAPEVLLEEEADGRADIFSLGVVFYELLARRHPFRAESFMGTCDRILHETPTPVSKVTPTVSSAVEAVVAHMMAKSPAERFPNAQELADELKRLQCGKEISFPAMRPAALRRSPRALAVGGVLLVILIVALSPGLQRRVKGWFGLGVLPQAKNLAVLPFEAIGGDREGQAYSDGITETLTAKLAQLTVGHQLQVAPAREVRARGVTTPSAARQELGAGFVIVGTVHRSGNTVRINCSLVDTVTRQQLRAQTITAAVSDPFAVQDRVVAASVQMLELELQPQERQTLLGSGTQIGSAQEYYLQGRGYLLNYDKRENIDSAIAAFTRALNLDPNYALAHAGLGEAYWKMYQASKAPAWIEQARVACERAQQLDPDLAQLYVCLGAIDTGTGNPERAVAALERAIQLEPTNDDAYRALGAAYQNLGKFDEAERTYRKAIQLRPHYWAGYSWLGAFYYGQARYKEAEEMFRKVVALVPDSFRGHSNLGAVLVEEGRYRDAIATLESSIAIRPTAAAYSNLGNAYFFSRRYPDAIRVFEQAVKLDEQDYLFWWNLGDAYYWSAGGRAQAVRPYRQAIALAEARLQVNLRDSDALGVSAVCHAMLGEEETAKKYIQRGLQINAEDAALRFRAALVYNRFGDSKAALDWLERAVAAGWSPTKLRDTPDFDPLRSDPRFKKLLGPE